MEFPSLGQHCHQSDCKQLDFLPMKCDACSEIFCKDHIQYSAHTCPESYKKDNQVPVCPLCNSLVPIKKGETPDVIVGRHIDNDCKSDTAKQRRKVYTNKCSFKGCKQKELIPVQCEKCRKNFCLRHRFEDDHECSGFEGTGQGMSRQGAAAINRFKGSSSTAPPKKSNPPPQQRTSQLSNIGSQLNRERQSRQQQSQGRQLTQEQARTAQAGLSEEEAMARAIQMSLAETQKTQQNDTALSQEDEDLLLAQALAASEEEARRESQRRRQQQQQPRQQQQDNNKTSCQVS